MDQKKFDTIKDFVRYCKKELEIQSLPKISLVVDKSFVEARRSFGEYNPSTSTVKVYVTARNLADICRSLAHELVHHRQSELNLIYDLAGETGSDIENDANAIAGVLMREYGRLNLNVYGLDTEEKPIKEVKIDLENEIFSAYNGRYIFDVTKAYNLIDKKEIKSIVKEFNPDLLYQFSHPEFNVADPEKVQALKIDYNKPVGILVKFENPETKKTEWILIDGNHRVRKATEEDKPAKLHVIADPKDTEKFMDVDLDKAHQLFPDED